MAEYEKLEKRMRRMSMGPAEIRETAYARVGLMGNPGDQMNGRCLGFTVSNFWASVTMRPSAKLVIEPHPIYDPLEFASISHAMDIGKRDGFYGGVRLLLAALKRFGEFCVDHGLVLPKRNFTVRYDTNIPKQVGLAGSSAIITAFIRALLQFYDLGPSDVPIHLLPNLVLSVEAVELHINAGPMDRVCQVYGGLMHMDLTKCYDPKKGAGQLPRLGEYERLPLSYVQDLPFFIAFERDPSDSGKIHSDTRTRWLQEDPEVHAGVAELASFTDQAVEALKSGDSARLADLMDQNFGVRRRLYGDKCLGANNLKMIKIAQDHGAAAKFPGSGGAVLGLLRKGRGSEEAIRAAYEAEDFVFCPLSPVGPRQSACAPLPEADEEENSST